MNRHVAPQPALTGVPEISPMPPDVFKSDLTLPDEVYILGSGVRGAAHFSRVPADAYVIALNKALQLGNANLWMMWAHAYFNERWCIDGWNSPVTKLFGDGMLKRMNRLRRQVKLGQRRREKWIDEVGDYTGKTDYTYSYMPLWCASNMNELDVRRYWWQKQPDFPTPARKMVRGLLRAGGSIAGAALQLCYWWDVKRVVFCGVDMLGHRHFDGTKGAISGKEEAGVECRWDSECDALNDMVGHCAAKGMEVLSLSETKMKVKRI